MAIPLWLREKLLLKNLLRKARNRRKLDPDLELNERLLFS